MDDSVWECIRCQRQARIGIPFGFKPYANFPAAPDCPHCFAKKSMQIKRVKEVPPKLKTVKFKLSFCRGL